MGFNDTKRYGAEKYTGMTVGDGHHWEYTNCEVKENKITPSEWDFELTSIKRRKGGWKEGRYWTAKPNRQITDREAPLGAKYRWLHFGIQDVEKIEADAYTMVFKTTKLKMEPSNRQQKDQMAVRLTELVDSAINAYLTTPEEMAKQYLQLRPR